ncbi:MAG: DNA repair protein RecN [Acidobacteriota bacterium]
MLSLLKIRNVALIDDLEIEFGRGLNLLTGETGSGKSIIVDSLSALTGERLSADVIKQGQESARIEGVFSVVPTDSLRQIFDEGGVELDDGREVDISVKRELSIAGKNRVFVNNQLVTQSFLKRIGTHLVDIHGQGEQATLFAPSNHIEILDAHAALKKERGLVAERHSTVSALQAALADLARDESNKSQLADILRFQVDEIEKISPAAGEDEALEEEARRLSNVEKLSSLSSELSGLLYEDERAIVSGLEKTLRGLEELSTYDSSFSEYREGLRSALAVLQDIAFAVRGFSNNLEFSPERLNEIEGRLSEITRLKRKYGGSIESVLKQLEESKTRLQNIETSAHRESSLLKELGEARKAYLEAAMQLSKKRRDAAKLLEKEVEKNLSDVALEKAQFQISITTLPEDVEDFSSKGINRVEFNFSANVGETPKPLSKVASGGEASRVMLVLKTSAQLKDVEKAVVFDEIDTGIGGRVAEAVGMKLKRLAETQQVLCVTHQPQVAALADVHFSVDKSTDGKSTSVAVTRLKKEERVEEIARMLAGEKITDTARKHAKELIGNRR